MNKRIDPVGHHIPEDSSDEKRKVTRRELLGIAWLGALGLAAIKAAGLVFNFSLPRIRKGEFGSIIDVGPFVEIPSPDDPPLNHPKGKFWLVHSKEGLHAFYKACTHLDCLFDWNSQEGLFICPCHGSRFTADGTCLNGPATRSLDRFVVQIVAGNGETLAESDPASEKPLQVRTVATNSSVSASDKENGLLIPEDALVRVDTGRRIPGRTVTFQRNR